MNSGEYITLLTPSDEISDAVRREEPTNKLEPADDATEAEKTLDTDFDTKTGSENITGGEESKDLEGNGDFNPDRPVLEEPVLDDQNKMDSTKHESSAHEPSKDYFPEIEPHKIEDDFPSEPLNQPQVPPSVSSSDTEPQKTVATDNPINDEDRPKSPRSNSPIPPNTSTTIASNPHIIASGMDSDGQQYAIELAQQANTQFGTHLMAIAHHLMVNFEQRYGPQWYCVVSDGHLGFYSRYNAQNHIYFTLNHLSIFLYKAE